MVAPRPRLMLVVDTPINSQEFDVFSARFLPSV